MLGGFGGERGYRPGCSALDAAKACRERCRGDDWLIDLDLSFVFDSFDHELAEIHLHYAFDGWMARVLPDVSFERYADVVAVHCKSRRRAWCVLEQIKTRLADWRLELNEDTAQVFHCKDSSGMGAHEHERFESLFTSFTLAVSDDEARELRDTIRWWRLPSASPWPSVSVPRTRRATRSGGAGGACWDAHVGCCESSRPRRPGPLAKVVGAGSDRGAPR